MKMRINIAYGSIAVTYLATVLSIHLGCLPYERNWQIFPDPGSEHPPPPETAMLSDGRC